jgi:hypothetical protein
VTATTLRRSSPRTETSSRDRFTEGKAEVVGAECLQMQRPKRWAPDRKALFPGPFAVAGAGFEPATSGL